MNERAKWARYDRIWIRTTLANTTRRHGRISHLLQMRTRAVVLFASFFFCSCTFRKYCESIGTSGAIAFYSFRLSGLHLKANAVNPALCGANGLAHRSLEDMPPCIIIIPFPIWRICATPFAPLTSHILLIAHHIYSMRANVNHRLGSAYALTTHENRKPGFALSLSSLKTLMK